MGKYLKEIKLTWDNDYESWIVRVPVGKKLVQKIPCQNIYDAMAEIEKQARLVWPEGTMA